MNEIFNSIWSISDNLRGTLDGWDFKNFVLDSMFLRGFLPELKFFNILKSENISQILVKTFAEIEQSTGLTGIFTDFDVQSSKLGNSHDERNKRIKKILQGVASMKLDFHSQNDNLGDAYEFLMSMYASNAGKSGGEFFTPPEVSELLTLIATDGKNYINKIYDPSCGSGSLLLQATKLLGKNNINGFYGQEINPTTFNLCRMNMFLHGVKFEIACDDTLLRPHLDNAPFDVIVSNPPYSVKWEGGDINDPRFSPAGVLAPKSKGDLAFVMHSLYCLAQNGTAAIVVFPGILYRTGAEQAIRKFLVDGNFIDTVIQLPDNLFFGTSIATCILILKKNKINQNVLFVDASNEFVANSKRKQLTAENINRIFQHKEIPSAIVSNEKIAKNDFILSVSAYIEPPKVKEVFDIHALNAEVKRIVAHNQKCREELDALVDDLERGFNFENS